MRSKILVLFLCYGPLTILAGPARVLEIHSAKKELILIQEKDQELRWKVKDRICIVRESSEKVCGEVQKANPYRVTLILDKGVDRESWNSLRGAGTDGFLELVFGDDLAHRSVAIRGLADLDRKLERRPNSAPVSLSPDLMVLVAHRGKPEEGVVDRDSHTNLTLGMTYLFPTVQWQHALEKHVTIGVMPQYLAASPGSGTLTGVGALGTVSFFSVEPFHGFFAQAGAGAFALSAAVAGVQEGYIAPVLLMQAGWRWLWQSGLNVGLGGGLQYLLQKPSNVDLGFSGAFPVVALDLGYAY